MLQAKDDKNDNPGFDQNVPFSALCKYEQLLHRGKTINSLARLFEKATKAKKHGQKKEVLQTFFSHYEDDNYFPVMRLLLPQVCILTH
jgi:hypothetical protein